MPFCTNHVKMMGNFQAPLGLTCGARWLITGGFLSKLTCMRHTISAIVENKFGVLARVSGMFSGRGFNIDTLNVGPTENRAYSRITATVRGDDEALDQCIKQLEKLVNVVEVKHYKGGGHFVARELVMLRVKASAETRSQIIEIADVFRAKIVDVGPDSVMIECTGNDNKISAFLELLEPYGLTELARTGNLALERRRHKDEDSEN